MIGLDLSEMDQFILEWVKYLYDLIKPEVIYFMHVEKDFKEVPYLPQELNEATALDEKLLEKMSETIHAHFPEDAKNIQIKAVEGKPFEALIHWADIKSVDFFIAGRKNEISSRGILPHKLARKLQCPVLFIPEIKPKEFQKLLIPIDFSKHSKLAILTALMLRDLIPTLEIKCMHVYQVPLGYYKTGKTFEEFGKIMLVHAKREFKTFCKEMNVELKCIYKLQSEASDKVIVNTAKQEFADLVIMGSKGQTNSSILLLGSLTEKLIQINDYCLSWIVKMKGENIGFFKALKHMK